MRFAAALFVAAHGIGYTIWFMATWAPSALGAGSRQLSIGDTAATGGLGKLFGILGLLVLTGFLITAWGVWQQTAWWPTALVASAIVAIPVAFSVWNPVGNVSTMAQLANLGLIVATVMPWGDRFLGAH